MADVSCLKINERSNGRKYNIKRVIYQRTSMRIDEIASNAKYRKEELLQNLTIF